MAERPRRIVRQSLVFQTQAEAIFPRGGSAAGEASFELFEEFVLPGIELQFSAGFDDLPVSEPGLDAIRHVMTHGLPWIPPLIVYGILLSNDEIDLIGNASRSTRTTGRSSTKIRPTRNLLKKALPPGGVSAIGFRVGPRDMSDQRAGA